MPLTVLRMCRSRCYACVTHGVSHVSLAGGAVAGVLVPVASRKANPNGPHPPEHYPRRGAAGAYTLLQPLAG
eukprot:2699383-Pyramimonas_sp.AAC.2